MSMQKQRVQDTFEHAVVEHMATFGADGCGGIISKSAQLVFQASNPDQEYQFNLNQGLALDVAYVTETGKEGPISRAFRRQLSKIVGPKHKPCERTDRIATFAKEAGEGLSAYTLLKGEKVSHNDGTIALRELDELQDVIKLLKRDVETAMGLELSVVGE